jgi:glycosyltransferase involved in cell wall biosynthesis
VGMKLSVIICVYNETYCIVDAIRSLYANEIFPETEVILVDDCSVNPVTIRLLSLIENFTRFKVIRSSKNKGLSNSRNLGFAGAQTPYIAPLDADDVMPANALDHIYQAFITHPQAGFVAGNYVIYDLDQPDEPTLVDCSSIAADGIVDAAKLVSDWKLLGTSPCKKSVWESVGGYNLKYSYSVQDVDFWIRVLLAGHKGFYLDEPIYTWKRSSSGMNMNFDRLDMIRLLNDHQAFYLLGYSPEYLYNTIFQGYYPYKQKDILLPFGRKYFFLLNLTNKMRMLSLMFRLK